MSLDATSSEWIKADAAAIAVSVAGGFVGVAASVGGTFVTNEISVATSATIDGQNAGSITVGSLDVEAKDQASITADALAAGVSAGFGAVGVAVAISVTIGLNTVNDDVTASISNEPLVHATAGDVQVGATEQATIEANAAAASFAVSVGAVAVSAAGAGASAENDILGGVQASLSDSEIESSSDVDVTALDTSVINANILAASAAVAVGLGGVGVAIGVALAENDIGSSSSPDMVTAYSSNSSVDASGAFNLSATNGSTINALVASFAAAVSAGVVGVSASGAGASATNAIDSNASAYVSGDTIPNTAVTGITVGSASISATNTSKIDAEVDSAAVSAAFGYVGVAAAVGVALATNTITSNVDAYVENADVKASNGSVSVSATSDNTITVQASAAAVSLSGGAAAISVAGGGANATNVILGDTKAYFSGGSITATKGDVSATATSTSTIHAEIAALSGSAAVGALAGAVALGFGLAENFIGYTSNGVADPGAVSAYASGTTINASGALTIQATSDDTINAQVDSFAAAIAGGLVALAGTGAASLSNNMIAVDTSAYVSGGGGTDGSIAVSASDTSTITSEVDSAAISAAIGLVAASAAIAASVAMNTISDTVDAYVSDANFTASSGSVTVTATKGDTITAKAHAAAVALSGGAAAFAVSGGGAEATNVILGGATADFSGGSITANHGGVSATAGSTSKIDAEVDALSASAAIGGLAGAAAIGASEARNFIGGYATNQAPNYVVGSPATLSGKVTLTTGDIVQDGSKSYVYTGPGETIDLSNNSALKADAHFQAIGAQQTGVIQAYSEGTAVSASGAFNLSATNGATITAQVASISAALTASLEGLSLSGAGASAANTVAIATKAFIDNSSNENAVISVGSINIGATDNSNISTTVGAAAIAGSIGLSASVSIAISIAQNAIDNTVDAHIANAPHVTSNGTTTVSAKETATIGASSTAAAVSAGLIAISGGGADAVDTITTDTQAYVNASTLHVGALTVSANDSSTATAATFGASAAIGLGVAAGGSIATTTIGNTVSAAIDGSTVDTTGLVSVSATGQPEGTATANGFTAGLVAVGGSKATVTVTPTITAIVDGTITAGGLTIEAFANVGSGPSADASASGSGGAVVDVTASYAQATDNAIVAAGIFNPSESPSDNLTNPNDDIATGTTVTLTGALVILADGATQQYASASNDTAGLVAVGAASSDAAATNSTSATVGGGAQVTAGSAQIDAYGNDNTFAATTAGTAGLYAGPSVAPTTSDNATTAATVGKGANVTLSDNGTTGAFEISADHVATVNTLMEASGIGLLANAGGTAVNTVTSQVTVVLNGAVTAYSISGSSENDFVKPTLSGMSLLDPSLDTSPNDNISGAMAGAEAGADASDTTTISFDTEVDVGSGSVLTVIGPTDVGNISLSALNTFFGYDQVTLTMEGAISGVIASSTIQTASSSLPGNGDLAKVDVAGTLVSAGQVDLSADGRGNVITQVNSNTYGIATGAGATSTVSLSPDNQVVIENGGKITADSDIDLLAGMDGNYNADPYTAYAYTDAFAGALIPIHLLNAYDYIEQTNIVTVAASAKLITGGSANLFAADFNWENANVLAQAKEVDWTTVVAGGLLSLFGGNPANQFTGTSFAMAHGVVEVDGSIQTGLLSNVSVTFEYDANNNIVEVTGPNSPSLDFKIDSNVVEQSGLTTAYTNAIQQYENDYGWQQQIGGPGVNSGVDQLVTTDANTVAALGQQLVAQGLASATSTSVVDGITVDRLISNTIQVIEVLAFQAEAGQINFIAGQVGGHGNLDAPTTANVSINDDTFASLQIDGILMPQLIGGVYVNGALLTEPTSDSNALADANAFIYAQNVATAAADNEVPASSGFRAVASQAAFASITLAQPPHTLQSGETPPATINIFTTQPNVAVGNYSPGGADINITGDIIALEANLIVSAPQGSINVTAPLIDVGLETFSAKNSLTLNVVTFQASGDPASQLLGTQIGTNAALANQNSNLAAFEATSYGNIPLTNPSSVTPTPTDYAEIISITAEYVNINGNIQAGDANQDLTISDSKTLDAQLASDNVVGTSYYIASLSTTDFTVRWNPTDTKGDGNFVVSKEVVAGGDITIKGQIYSTSKGSLNALGYYGNINITNNTTHGLILNQLDASAPGTGIINVTDLNYEATYNGVTYAQDTIYDAVAGQTMLKTVEWIDPTNGKELKNGNIPLDARNGQPIGDPQPISSSSASYSPNSGARFQFVVAADYTTTTIELYTTSSWLGIIPTGSSVTFNHPPVVTTSPATIQPAESLYYVDASAAGNTSDIYNTQTITFASKNGWQTDGNWQTSTWYGDTTYYFQYKEQNGNETISTNSIPADLPIGINFDGYASSNVTINSVGAVTLLGGIGNTTGTTSITSGGPIVQEASGAAGVATPAVEGVNVILNVTGNGGIGSAALPLNVIIEGTAGKTLPGQSTAENPSLTAITANGGIYISASQGALPIYAVNAGGDSAVSLTSEGAMTATSAPPNWTGGGTAGITGGNVSLNSGGGIGSSSAWMKLGVGQNTADQLNVSAQGDVYLEQTAGNLPLFKLTASGQAFITVDNGSLLNVNTNVVQDTRTTAQLEDGVWTDLNLTNSDYASIAQPALTEYQSYQDQQYQTFWNDVNALEGAPVTLDAGEAVASGSTDIFISSSAPVTLTADGAISVNSATIALSANAPGTVQAGMAVYDETTGTYLGTVLGTTPSTSTSLAELTLTADAANAGSSGDTLVLLSAPASGAVQEGMSILDESTGVYLGTVSSVSSTQPELTLSAGAISAAAAGDTLVLTAPPPAPSSLSTSTQLLTPAQVTYYTQLYEGQGETATQAAASVQTLNVSLVSQYAQLFAVFGPGGTYAQGSANVYDPATNAELTFSSGVWSSTGATLAQGSVTYTGTPTGLTTSVVNGQQQLSGTNVDVYNPNIYDPNFRYLLTTQQAQSQTNGVKQFTQQQLLGALSAGLLTDTTSTQVNIEQPNITATNIVISTPNGNVGSLVNPVTNEVGLVAGTTIVDGSPVQLALASAQRSDLNFLAAIPVQETVNFANNGSNQGTVTWTGGVPAGMTITKGTSLYIGGSTINSTENDNYVQVDSIVTTGSGANETTTVTFLAGETFTAQTNQTVLIAPVVLGTDQSTLSGPTTSEVVNFSNFNNSGTITLVNGQSWGSAYVVGEGVYIGSQTGDPNSNGKSFSTQNSNPYYTITAVNGDVLTVHGLLTAENGATVDVAPVNITGNTDASAIKYVLITQNWDIAIAASGTVTANSGGFVFFGSQDTVKVNTIVAGSVASPAEARLRTQGSVINANTSAIDIQGSGIVIEAGESFIGTSSLPVTVKILGAQGSLTARALDNIYIDAPQGDIPVSAVFTSANVYLTASGSIYDADPSDFAKIAAGNLFLDAGATIGANGFALHVDVTGNSGRGRAGQHRHRPARRQPQRAGRAVEDRRRHAQRGRFPLQRRQPRRPRQSGLRRRDRRQRRQCLRQFDRSHRRRERRRRHRLGRDQLQHRQRIQRGRGRQRQRRQGKHLSRPDDGRCFARIGERFRRGRLHHRPQRQHSERAVGRKRDRHLRRGRSRRERQHRPGGPQRQWRRRFNRQHGRQRAGCGHDRQHLSLEHRRRDRRRRPRRRKPVRALRARRIHQHQDVEPAHNRAERPGWRRHRQAGRQPDGQRSQPDDVGPDGQRRNPHPVDRVVRDSRGRQQHHP